MSHHLDSPLARQDPRLNITDQYLFDVQGATALVMDVSTSLAGDQHADAFDPEARYEFKVHLDGAAVEELTYRFAFAPAVDGRQRYTLAQVSGAVASSDNAAGGVLAEGHTGEPVATLGGGQVWAGRAVEPFFLDLKQLDAVDRAVQRGDPSELGAFDPRTAADTFAGSSVQAIVLTVPTGDGALRSGRRIAVWSTSKVATHAGGWQQVGRAGLPMVWPIFRDADSDQASQANRTHPGDDARLYGARLTGLVASAVQSLGTSEAPDAYAAALVGRIIPDVLGFTVGTPACFGFAEINGRRLSDNAPEVMFTLALNAATPTGLRAGEVRRSQEQFPYVVPVST